MASDDDVVSTLGGLALFADLPRPELEQVAHTFEEAMFGEGQRVLRQGFAGSGFYVILDGEAAVSINGEEVAHLAKGDFFGEISALLGETPTADIIAIRPLRCLLLSGEELPGFLMSKPTVMLRLLQAEARRLRGNIEWRN